MKHASLIAASCAALLSGCVKQEYHTDGRVNTDPLVIDQAMQLRDWDKSHASYENGGTKNWSTGFGYAARGDLGYGLNYLVDLGTYFGNLVTLPLTAIDERDGVVSSGVNVPESYTAVASLPQRTPASGMGVGPTNGGQGNVQGATNGNLGTNGNVGAAQNDQLQDSSITGNAANRANLNGGNNTGGTVSGGTNGAGNVDSSVNGGTGAGSTNSNSNSNSNADAANADVSSGGTSGSGKSRNSGSATGSGAGGSSGAGGAGK